jgi:hypothetical protein
MATASNTLLTDDIITNEALAVLRNQFVLASRALRPVDDLFGQTGMKAGDTIRVRVPVRYTSATGAAVNKQNSTETNTNIQLIQRNIGMGFSSKDRTLSIDDFSSRFIAPAMAQLANDIDQDGFALFYKIPNLVTPGSYSAGIPAAFTGADVSTLRPFLDAGARLTEQAAPIDNDRYVAVTPSAQAGVLDGLKGLFQSADQIADQYKRGLMGIAAGFQWVVAQALPSFTCGTRTNVTPIVNGAQTGSSLLLSGAGNTLTVSQGDQFTIGGVYAINPLTRLASNKLQVFTVLTAATTSAGGAVTLSISPAINVTAPNQTVSAQAANGATVTWIGAANTVSDVNIAWHKNAFMVAFCQLTSDLSGADASVATDPESGISVRLVKQYNAETDEQVTRLDVLYGWQVVRPTLAVRIQG